MHDSSSLAEEPEFADLYLDEDRVVQATERWLKKYDKRLAAAEKIGPAAALQAELSWLEGTRYEENKFVLAAFMGQVKRSADTEKPAKKSKTRRK